MPHHHHSARLAAASDALPPAYNPIKEIGGYDTLPQDVKDALPDLTNIPESAQLKAQAAMADEAAKPETTKNLMDEVKALGDSAIKVDEAFERVRVGLGKVDQNDYKDKSGQLIPKFQPTWVGYQKRWTTMLWGSKDVATKTEAYIKDFVNVIVPEVEDIQNNDDLADARLDLAAFIKRTDPFGKQLNSQETVDAAQKYSQDFTDLRRDLEAFKDTFDSFAADHKVELDTAIRNKQSDIETLKLEIKQCQTVVAAMGIALGVTIFAAGAGAVAALAAFGPVGPAVALGIVIVGAIAAIGELSTLIAFIVKTNEKQNDLDRAQRELANLQAQLKQLEELKAILDSQKTDITDICGRLDQFAAIWGLVRHDAELINSDLNAAVGDEGSKKAFKQRISLIKDSYTKLGDALALYATTVSTGTNQ